MDTSSFIAFDLGAESGRTILGTLAGIKLSIQQVTRFANEMKTVDGHLHWDIDGLFGEMKKGLRACAALGARPQSLGVDTWGVDFGLQRSGGDFLMPPFAYRDHRTEGMMEKFFELVPKRRVYELTGIQFLQLNTLYQLYATSVQRPDLIRDAARLLFMPDIFNYFFAGTTSSEFTFATTSQMYNPRSKRWDGELLSAMDLSPSIMQEIVQPATRLGTVRRSIADEAGIGELAVTAVASHDTGSAIAAIPAEGSDWAYISSGTWSLMGSELPQPVITDDALRSNFTNEGGVGGTFRFLKNIMGLWLLQQCRKEWASEKQYEYSELVSLAENAAPFRSLLNPDYEGFFNPASMSAAIVEYCRKSGQPAPASHGEFVRAILESLALKYRQTLDQLQQLTGRAVNRIHVIGGGAQNALLCQYTANATGTTVIAGPVEATAIGNIMVQALAAGHVGSLQDIRTVVRHSFDPVTYRPQETGQWQEAYGRYQQLTIMSH
ncbi:MAG TPA: rhamnulokinase family protein [Bacteroidota bacterium]|nr:rhamnulokinase family protein [Bacteroidota bacterium]